MEDFVQDWREKWVFYTYALMVIGALTLLFLLRLTEWLKSKDEEDDDEDSE